MPTEFSLAAIPLRYRTGKLGERMKRWAFALRSGTRVKSTATLRNMLSFYVKTLLPALGVTVESDLTSNESLVQLITKEGTVQAICGNGKMQARRWRWACDFFEHIMQTERPELPRQVAGRIQTESYGARGEQISYGHDHHRIDNQGLEKMDAAFSGDMIDHLIFRILLTTGLRIGAAARIKLTDVVDEDGTAKRNGKTIEKGGKTVCFRMRSEVRELVTRWVQEGRGHAGSEYLFPGRTSGWMAPDTLRKRLHARCQAANIEGTEFHPHALRHTFAHLLLESGTDLQDISRLLNHSNVQTTQKFYLRESLDEFLQRANIPMYEGDYKTGPKQGMPAFLMNNEEREQQKNRRAKKRKGIKDTLERLKKLRLK